MTAQRDRYQQLAETNARDVIRQYSTSFGVASSLLAKPIRQHVANVYGLVRLADEIVDGVASEYGMTQEAIVTALDALERETLATLQTGYSTNLIVHAFAGTARQCQIGPDLIVPFFTSMRMDTQQTDYTPESFARYVYGSAEVVGLMCLKTFFDGAAPENEHDFVRGARALGSAFQKVNFLRDLAADVDGLGRHYFPGIDFDLLSDADKNALVADIEGELAIARQMIPMLPATSRRAVWLAASLFTELNRRIERTPAAVLKTRRISVPATTKARLYVQTRFGGAR